MLHVGVTPGWRGVCVKHGSGESMRVEVELKVLGERGGPAFVAPLALASIPVIDDGDASSRANAELVARRITVFRHSLGGFAACASCAR